MSDELTERKASVQEDKNFSSGKISDLSRYIAFGIMALSFTLLTSSSDFAKALVLENKQMILSAGFFAALAIVVDYAHYYFAYLDSSRVLRTTDFYYSKRSVTYQLRNICFWLKQVSAFLAAVIIIVLILIEAYGG